MAKQTWIYLMKDETNDCYKIGRSQTPEYRERTLQSEKPFIVLIEAWECAPDLEIKLHNVFSKQRIRGEWFRLSETDVAAIHHIFHCSIKFSNGMSDEFEARQKKQEKQRNLNYQKTYELADKSNCLDFAVEALGFDFY